MPYVRFPHTRVLLANVVKPMVAHTYRYGYGELVEELNAEQRRCAQRLLERIQSKLCEFCPQERIELRVLEGEALAALLEIVSSEHVDFVVVAQRHKRPLLKMFSRSVSDALTASACCSTLVLKPQVWQGYEHNAGIPATHTGAGKVAYPRASETAKELANIDRR